MSPSPRLAHQQQQLPLQQQRAVQATQGALPLQQQQPEQQEAPEQGEEEAYADDFGASAEDAAAAGVVEAPVSVKRQPSITFSHPPPARRTYSDAAVGSDDGGDNNGVAGTGASVLSAEEQYVRAEATRIQAHYLAQAARITASAEISPPPPGNPAARMAWPAYEEAKEEQQQQQQPQQQVRVPVVVGAGRGSSAAALQAPRRPFAAAPSATPMIKQHKMPMPVPASLSAQRSPLYQPLRVEPEEASYWASAAANATAATSPSASSVQQPYLPQHAEHAVPYPPYHAHYYKATAANAASSMMIRPGSAKR
jgi:hypothetical protein